MYNEENIIGYCLYCKNDIYEGEPYVVRGKDLFHTDCYELIEEDSYGASNDEDFTETEN